MLMFELTFLCLMIHSHVIDMRLKYDDYAKVVLK